MQDLEHIIEKFEKMVSQNFCHCLAKRVGFIQRSTSQIKGYEFAQAMMVPNAFLEAETLNSLAIRMLKINKECNLSASALAQRMNTKAAEKFMKACFEKMLKETIQNEFSGFSDLPNLVGFTRVLIEDSTKAELHEKLSPYFQGSGGVASKAAVKIDFIFDYQSEKIVDMHFFSGNTPDQALAGRAVFLLEKGDLLIRDLGYYALARIKEIEESNAYYISRFKSDLEVYEDKDAAEPIDLARFLDQQSGQGVVDTIVFISKAKHPVRLVACSLSEEAINQRLRSANREAVRRGRQTSKKKLALLKYNIFITNIPIKMLSSVVVMATYRARWRVELIFKQWKSCLKLHLFKGYKKERFHCLLYGRLIMILLLGSMTPILMRHALTLGRELSCFKLINYLIADHSFAIALQEGRIRQLIGELFQEIPRRLCLDKRKRPSLRSNVRLGHSYYNELEHKYLKNKAA